MSEIINLTARAPAKNGQRNIPFIFIIFFTVHVQFDQLIFTQIFRRGCASILCNLVGFSQNLNF